MIWEDHTSFRNKGYEPNGEEKLLYFIHLEGWNYGTALNMQHIYKVN